MPSAPDDPSVTPAPPDHAGAAIREHLSLQAEMIGRLKSALDESRDALDRKILELHQLWRRLRLHELLLENWRAERAELEGKIREAGQEAERLQHEVQGARAELSASREETARRQEDIEHLHRTLSWRLTTPLRTLPALFRSGSAPGGREPAQPLPRAPEGPPPAIGAPRRADPMESALAHLRDKGFRPGAVLDVGAAKGHWSERAAFFFPEARFYMIDPLAESEESLKDLCAREPRMRYFVLALGRAPGSALMNIGREPDASSLLEFPGQDPSSQRTVAVETVDRMLADGRLPMPDLVKLDVQGFELEVLAGGERLLGAAEVFIVEVNLFEFMPRCPLVDEVVGFFAARGYRIFDLAGALRRPYQDDLGQMDIVFVSNRSPLAASSRWE